MFVGDNELWTNVGRHWQQRCQGRWPVCLNKGHAYGTCRIIQGTPQLPSDFIYELHWKILLLRPFQNTAAKQVLWSKVLQQSRAKQREYQNVVLKAGLLQRTHPFERGYSHTSTSAGGFEDFSHHRDPTEIPSNMWVNSRRFSLIVCILRPEYRLVPCFVIFLDEEKKNCFLHHYRWRLQLKSPRAKLRRSIFGIYMVL